MKRKTFYFLSLLLPYLVFAASVLYAVANDFAPFGGSAPQPSPGGFFVLFALAGVFWVPLYTWMAGAVLFWGRGKTAEEVRTMYLLLPVLLGCSMGYPVILIDLPGSGVLLVWGLLRAANLEMLGRFFFEEYQIQATLVLIVVWAMMFAACLVVGYVFVGIVLLIERWMKQAHRFREEVQPGGRAPVPVGEQVAGAVQENRAFSGPEQEPPHLD